MDGDVMLLNNHCRGSALCVALNGKVVWEGGFKLSCEKMQFSSFMHHTFFPVGYSCIVVLVI